jgi:hypothetical protein
MPGKTRVLLPGYHGSRVDRMVWWTLNKEKKMQKSRIFGRLLGAAMMLALAACSNDHHATSPPIAAQQFQAAPMAAAPAAPATTIVQAPQSDGMKDMLTGAALGALATHALTGPDRQSAVASQAPVVRHTTVVQKTVVVNQTPSPRPVVAAAAASPAPAAAPPRSTAIPSYAPPKTAAPTSYKVSYSMPSSSSGSVRKR